MCRERARGQKYHTSRRHKGLFSTYRSLALAFFDERERVSEREGRRKESQKHTTQFTFIVIEDGRKIISSLSHSLAPWQSQQSLVGKIWHAVCNRCDLFLSIYAIEREKRLRLMAPMCQFSRLQLHENKQRRRFSGRLKLILRLFPSRKKWPRARKYIKINWCARLAGKRSLKRRSGSARKQMSIKIKSVSYHRQCKEATPIQRSQKILHGDCWHTQKVGQASGNLALRHRHRRERGGWIKSTPR